MLLAAVPGERGREPSRTGRPQRYGCSTAQIVQFVSGTEVLPIGQIVQIVGGMEVVPSGQIDQFVVGMEVVPGGQSIRAVSGGEGSSKVAPALL